VANNVKKSNPVVEPKEVRCYSSKKSSLQVMASEQSQIFFAFAVRRGAKVRSPNGEKFAMQSWENFGYQLDSSYWQTNEVFWQTIRRLRSKRSHAARSIKD